MKNTQNNQVEPKNAERKAEEFEAVELLVDYDSVNIGKARYKELIKTEVMVEIIEKSYHTYPTYKVDDILSLLFGPKDDQDAE